MSSSLLGTRQIVGLVLGPACLIFTLVVPAPSGLEPVGWHTAGMALLMAVFWICESIPIPITALLPLVCFPLLGIASVGEAAEPFADKLIFLFLGGFLIALGMQKWNLHKRIAVNLLALMGTSQRMVIAGFLIASAFISMWVSNTATALMMLPIALSILHLVPSDQRGEMRPFATALLLAVAYGATTGGMATLIGTPPNALLAAHLSKVYEIEVGFAAWMMVGLPITVIALGAVYLVLTRFSFKLGKGDISGMDALLAHERSRLGRWSQGEIIVGIVFLCTAGAWILSAWLKKHIPGIDDTVIAIAGGTLLFALPAGKGRGMVMDWGAAKDLPWDVLLLFGGGLSLASAIADSGLAAYLGDLCRHLDVLPLWLLLAIVCFGILMLTELTSNTATAATFLPVLGAIAVTLGRDPMLFLIPTALAANCSYMMPVGTPPNAIVFGSGQLKLPDMARAGLLLNVVLVPIILLLVLLTAPKALGMRLERAAASPPAQTTVDPP